jgi:hypothetical protein
MKYIITGVTSYNKRIRIIVKNIANEYNLIKALKTGTIWKLEKNKRKILRRI